MRVHRRFLGAVGFTLLLVFAGSTAVEAAQGFGFQASKYSISDDVTKGYLSDSTIVPEVFYRGQFGPSCVAIELGYVDDSQSGFGEKRSLSLLPLTIGWSYHFFHKKPVSLTLGVGAKWFFYELNRDWTSGFTIYNFDQTGYFLALEPRLGVEFLANKPVRLFLEAKYAQQILSTEDLDTGVSFVDPVDVDFSGLFVSAGISFMFGK